MSEEQPQLHRRAADAQIPLLSAKVGHLEATVESQGRWIQDVDTKIDETRREIGQKIDHLSATFDQKTRFPMLPFVALLFTGGAFLATIFFQAIKGQGEFTAAAVHHLNQQHETHEELGIRHKQAFREHIKDGHSGSVRELMNLKEMRLDERITVVDEQHAFENIEQEEDIEALRETNQRVEERLDAYLERIAILETRFDRVVGHSSQGFHQKDARQVIDPLRERIRRIEERQESTLRPVYERVFIESKQKD